MSKNWKINLDIHLRIKVYLFVLLTRKDAIEKNQANHDFGHQGILATLGDAILKGILVQQLMYSGCDTAEKITDEKREIENRDILASISKDLMIGKFMLMSNGERIKRQMKCLHLLPKRLKL
jgi:dsRNA-specific ribonuclease